MRLSRCDKLLKWPRERGHSRKIHHRQREQLSRNTTRLQEDVAFFAMLSDVEPLSLFVLSHAESHREIEHL